MEDIEEDDDAWATISSLNPGSTADSCHFKLLSLRKYRVSQHNWNKHEDELLARIASNYIRSPSQWRLIAQQLYKTNTDPHKIYRHPKQCREHYMNFLNPSIHKGAWTPEEDLTLLSQLKLNPDKRWSHLVQILNRTQNAIKNRFQLLQIKLTKNTLRESSDRNNLYDIYWSQMVNKQFLHKQSNVSQPAFMPQPFVYYHPLFQFANLSQMWMGLSL